MVTIFLLIQCDPHHLLDSEEKLSSCITEAEARMYVKKNYGWRTDYTSPIRKENLSSFSKAEIYNSSKEVNDVSVYPLICSNREVSQGYQVVYIISIYHGI